LLRCADKHQITHIRHTRHANAHDTHMRLHASSHRAWAWAQTQIVPECYYAHPHKMQTCTARTGASEFTHPFSNGQSLINFSSPMLKPARPRYALLSDNGDAQELNEGMGHAAASCAMPCGEEETMQYEAPGLLSPERPAIITAGAARADASACAGQLGTQQHQQPPSRGLMHQQPQPQLQPQNNSRQQQQQQAVFSGTYPCHHPQQQQQPVNFSCLFLPHHSFPSSPPEPHSPPANTDHSPDQCHTPATGRDQSTDLADSYHAYSSPSTAHNQTAAGNGTPGVMSHGQRQPPPLLRRRAAAGRRASPTTPTRRYGVCVCVKLARTCQDHTFLFTSTHMYFIRRF